MSGAGPCVIHKHFFFVIHVILSFIKHFPPSQRRAAHGAFLQVGICRFTDSILGFISHYFINIIREVFYRCCTIYIEMCPGRNSLSTVLEPSNLTPCCFQPTFTGNNNNVIRMVTFSITSLGEPLMATDPNIQGF